jgi:hypothetical protein
MAHYLAFRRLLELKLYIVALVNEDAMAPEDQKILTPQGSTTANKKKAREMVAVIEDGSFWHSLARYEPFLVARALDQPYLFNAA